MNDWTPFEFFVVLNLNKKSLILRKALYFCKKTRLKVSERDRYTIKK